MNRRRFLSVARRAAAVAALALTFGSGALDAQQNQQRGPRGDRAQLEQRIMAHFSQLVKNELGLDSAATAGLFTVVEEFGSQRRELQMREARLSRQLRGTGVYLSEEQSAAALEEVLAIKRQEVVVLEAEQERLSQVLTPAQVLRFYALREQMGERIRRLRGEGPRGDAEGPQSLPNELPELLLQR